MDAVERWASHYQELEPLSVCLKNFHGLVRSFGEPATEANFEQARSKILAETADLQSQLDAIQDKITGAKENLREVPLNSLSSLHSQLQSPSSHVNGGEALCEGLATILESADRAAPSQTNQLLEAWVQEFIREPLEEMFQHATQVSGQLEKSMTVEHGIMSRIRALSEQICEPGYRVDRVELMDERSVLVQHLLEALVAKQRVVGASEAKMALLEKKQRLFEQARSACLRSRHDQVAENNATIEALGRIDETLRRYSQQKLQGFSSEEQALDERRIVRERKMQKLSEQLKEVFEGILESIEECRHDSMRFSKVASERDQSDRISQELARSALELQEASAASCVLSEKGAKLEAGFSDWLVEVYRIMHEQGTHRFQTLRNNFSTDKARMLSLSRIAVEHVRAQREQVARALEQKTAEFHSCQESISIMEFSRPDSEEIEKTLNRLEIVRESMDWQQKEVDALMVAEDRISHNAAEIVSDTFGSESQTPIGEEAWANEVANADVWVTEFFYTWSKDMTSQQPPRSSLSVTACSSPTNRGAFQRYGGPRQIASGSPPPASLRPQALLMGSSGSAAPSTATEEGSPIDGHRLASPCIGLEGKMAVFASASSSTSPPKSDKQLPSSWPLFMSEVSAAGTAGKAASQEQLHIASVPSQLQTPLAAAAEDAMKQPDVHRDSGQEARLGTNGTTVRPPAQDIPKLPLQVNTTSGAAPPVRRHGTYGSVSASSAAGHGASWMSIPPSRAQVNHNIAPSRRSLSSTPLSSTGQVPGASARALSPRTATTPSSRTATPSRMGPVRQVSLPNALSGVSPLSSVSSAASARSYRLSEPATPSGYRPLASQVALSSASIPMVQAGAPLSAPPTRMVVRSASASALIHR